MGAILEAVPSTASVVLANGFISRDGYAHDRDANFYMLGSMGLAASIGLGVALARPDCTIVVIDGDGNLLMGLSALPMVGAWQPLRFLHVVLDNGTYASTGGQPTVAAAVNFPSFALASGYRRALSESVVAALPGRVEELLVERGPTLLHIRVNAFETPRTPRVALEPVEIADRFSRSIEALQ